MNKDITNMNKSTIIQELLDEKLITNKEAVILMSQDPVIIGMDDLYASLFKDSNCAGYRTNEVRYTSNCTYNSIAEIKFNLIED